MAKIKEYSTEQNYTSHLLEMENKRMDCKETYQKDLLKLLNEIYGKIQNLPLAQFHIYHSKIRQLHQQVVGLPNESVSFEGDLPTSSVCVESLLSQYIYECLQDSFEQNGILRKFHR